MLANKARAKKIMEKHGLDALVATTPENVAYLTGFWILSYTRHRPRQVYAVISRDDMEPDMIVSKGLIDHPFQGKTWVRQFHLYGQFYYSSEDLGGLDDESRRLLDSVTSFPSHDSAVSALVHCLKVRGLSSASVGVDQGSDIVFLVDMLKSHLPDLKTKPAYEIFREIRLIKTDEEIARIRRAVEVNENALADAIESIGRGVSEKQLSQTFKESVIRQDGFPTLECVGFGPRGAFPNVQPSDRKIEPGDVVRFDVACMVNAYHSDLARTAVLGKPSEKIRKYHDALMAGQGKILEALKPGITAGRLFDIGMEEVQKGIPHYQRHHCGHGNGIEGYDLPLISPNNPTQMKPGMVLCVETPYYEIGFAGLQIEDVVAITDHGHEQISQIERKLFVI